MRERLAARVDPGEVLALKNWLYLVMLMSAMGR